MTLDERDFFKDPFTRQELEELASIITVDELFPWRSPSAKQHRDQRGSLSEADLIGLMLDEPRLIRRPIFIRADDPSRYALGGRKADLEALSQG